MPRFDDSVIDMRGLLRRLAEQVVNAEMYATGTSTRKVRRVTEKLSVSRLSKDQASAIASSLDGRHRGAARKAVRRPPVPYVWLDATYVKCRCEGRVAFTAVVTSQ